MAQAAQDRLRLNQEREEKEKIEGEERKIREEREEKEKKEKEDKIKEDARIKSLNKKEIKK